MSAFINSIESAFILFPLIAFFFTIPYLVYEYHKYGSIPAYRSLIIYSFLLYLLCSYFLVILPLPSKNVVMQMKIPQYNLIPFHFISEIVEKTTFHASDFATYFPTLKNPVVYEALFNILLLVPFGVYLKYYFNFNFKKTFFYSFCYSLFFELTQLTGLYFIYQRGYRVFDVDDLILNTFGGIIGALIGKLLCKILPNKEKIDEYAYKNGAKVSILRRITCFTTDTIIVSLVSLTIYGLLKKSIIISSIFYILIFIIIILIYYIVIPFFNNNATLAMNFFHLRFHTAKKLTILRLASYYFFKVFVYLFLPTSLIGMALIIYKEKIITMQLLKYTLIAIWTLTLIIYMTTILKRILNRQTIPEKLSKVTIENTLVKR